jgi:hypothetical protein
MKACQYCKKEIVNTENVSDKVIMFCNSICLWMFSEGEDMLKEGKFPELDRR